MPTPSSRRCAGAATASTSTPPSRSPRDLAGVEAGLGPLAYLLELSRAARLSCIEVYAWSGGEHRLQRASVHRDGDVAVHGAVFARSRVFNTHGFFVAGDDNWLTQTHPNFTAGTVRYPATGTPLISLGWRLSDGNWWMDPGHPAAADYTVNVIKHLVANYDIDGLHLDRIRYPEMPIARPAPTGPIGFFDRLQPGERAPLQRRVRARRRHAAGSVDADWSQWRRDRDESARAVRLYLEIVHIKPKMKVSASTIAFWRGHWSARAASRTPKRTRACSRIGTAGCATASSISTCR